MPNWKKWRKKKEILMARNSKQVKLKVNCKLS